MALDTDKIDEAVLALLFLTRHQHWRAWKEFDLDALDRLYEKGLIGDRSTRPSPSCSPRRACAAPKNSSRPCSPNRIDPAQKAGSAQGYGPAPPAGPLRRKRLIRCFW